MLLQEAIAEASALPQISDIHIKEGDPVWVRYQGEIQKLDMPEVKRDHIVEFLRKTESSTGIQADKIRNSLDEGRGDIDFAVKVGKVRFRANVYHTNGKRIAIALRRLADSAPELSTLNLPDAFGQKLLTQSRGLILVTGETGSGKSTTLASTIEHFNAEESKRIITLEDPVEYLIKSKKCEVDQRQIGRDAASFSEGLRAALRQDPDILLIGELRDFETIQTALTAAMTGHLVLASLHTSSARQSIERITSEFGATRREWAHMVLSQALLGCLTQTLVRRADGSGRVLAAELLVCTPDVQAAIRDGKSAGIFNAMDMGASRGQVLMNSCLKNYVRQGIISYEDALYATYDPANLRKELGLD